MLHVARMVYKILFVSIQIAHTIIAKLRAVARKPRPGVKIVQKMGPGVKIMRVS